MTSYIASLNRYVEEENSKRIVDSAAAHEVAAAARDRLTPLEVRLARLLASIPEEIQREGLSLTSLRVGLKGRWRGSCHPGDLGQALRKLGYVRKRSWRQSPGGGFNARWFRAA